MTFSSEAAGAAATTTVAEDPTAEGLAAAEEITIISRPRLTPIRPRVCHSCLNTLLGRSPLGIKVVPSGHWEIRQILDGYDYYAQDWHYGLPDDTQPPQKVKTGGGSMLANSSLGDETLISPAISRRRIGYGRKTYRILRLDE